MRWFLNWQKLRGPIIQQNIVKKATITLHAWRIKVGLTARVFKYPFRCSTQKASLQFLKAPDEDQASAITLHQRFKAKQHLTV